MSESKAEKLALTRIATNTAPEIQFAFAAKNSKKKTKCIKDINNKFDIVKNENKLEYEIAKWTLNALSDIFSLVFMVKN